LYSHSVMTATLCQGCDTGGPRVPQLTGTFVTYLKWTEEFLFPERNGNAQEITSSGKRNAIFRAEGYGDPCKDGCSNHGLMEIRTCAAFD